jgi:hypothetical protein
VVAKVDSRLVTLVVLTERGSPETLHPLRAVSESSSSYLAGEAVSTLSFFRNNAIRREKEVETRVFRDKGFP